MKFIVKIIFLDTKKEYIDSRYDTYQGAVYASIQKNNKREAEYYNKVYYYADILEDRKK